MSAHATRLAVPLFAILPALALCAVPLEGQTVLQVEGGGTTLTGGYGSRVNFWSGDFEGWLGAGFARGWRLAAFVKHPLGQDTLRAGFDVQSLALPTDIFSGGSFLLTQGLAWRRVRSRFDATLFAGATGSGLGAPFVNTARAEKPIGLALVDVHPLPSLLLQTRLVGARRQSGFETVAWSTDDAAHTFAATAGVGANAPFGALTWHTTTDHLELRAGYTDFAPDFRRADAPLPDLAEPYHESVLMTLREPGRASLTLGHQNFRQLYTTTVGGGPDVRVDQALASVMLFGTTLGAGGFQTSTVGGRTLSTVSSVTQPLPFGTSATALYFQTFHRGRPAIRSLQGEVREPVGSSLTLSEVFTRTGRGFSAGLGGHYQRGFTTVALDYQNYYVPLRQPDPFLRTLTLTVRLQLGNTSASVGTTLDPFGHVSYAASGGTYVYLGGLTPGVQPITVRFERYVVRGVVEDEDGRPVDGAAVDVGDAQALTDSHGDFFVRVNARRSVPLRVDLAGFVAVGSYAVVSAPATVEGEDDEHATPVRIVLRTVPPPGAAVATRAVPRAPVRAAAAATTAGPSAAPRSTVVIPLRKDARSHAAPRSTVIIPLRKDAPPDHSPRAEIRIRVRKDAGSPRRERAHDH